MPNSVQFRPDVSSFYPKNGHVYAHFQYRNNVSGTRFPSLSPPRAAATLRTRPGNIRPISNRVTRFAPPISSRQSVTVATTVTTPQKTYQLPVGLVEVMRCPILFDTVSIPMITPSGITYNRPEIHLALQRDAKDPSTRKPCSVRDLRNNYLILAILDIVDTLEKTRDTTKKEALKEKLLKLFCDATGKFFTNPVVDENGNTFESEEKNPNYKNIILMNIMEVPVIKALIEKAKEKQIQAAQLSFNVMEKQSKLPEQEKQKPAYRYSFWSTISNIVSVISGNVEQMVSAVRYPH
ncbi:MAG: U-box domain-containing protein [Pseudomonadota bacterium]